MAFLDLLGIQGVTPGGVAVPYVHIYLTPDVDADPFTTLACSQFSPIAGPDRLLNGPWDFRLTVDGQVHQHDCTEPVRLRGHDKRYYWRYRGSTGSFIYRQNLPPPELED